MLVPILQVLFIEDTSKAVPLITSLPNFSFSLDYFVNLFYYYFNQILSSPDGKLKILYFVCGIFLVSMVLSNLFNYLSQRIMEDLRNHTLLNLRKAVFEKVMSFHLGYFSNERKGDIISKVTADVQVVQGSITNTLLVFFKEPINLIGYVILLFSMSAKLTLFTLLIIPISGTIISKIVKRLRENATEAQVTFGRMIGFLDEALTAMKIVQAFNAAKFIEKKFHDENLKYTRIQRAMVRRQELASPVSEILGALVIVGIILYGGSLIMSNHPSLSAATFVAYIVAYSQVLRPAKTITSNFGSIQHGIAAGKRVLELIDTKVEITDKPNAIEVKEFNSSIEFKNVTFAYQNTEVLKNVSFELKKGKTIALVGPSGGGKSTISDLIPRFYDPKDGAILLDGIDLRDCKMDSIRAQMGIVSQEALLFNDSIFNNIAFGKPNATKEEVIKAAQVANAHEFILKTEDGYNTFIGDRGMKLSGGQKQRISIARAVLKNPPILILDEATSALDTESEKLVQEALSNLMKNRTSLVIAHRLSTIQNADEILVIQNGKIIEKGNHLELLKLDNGLYKKLSQMQTNLQESN
jgi:subfamily B ATP-binding cassette protein MsbA